ncbi:conserved hypothetical protein [Trichormus variabilis ATCC 29413]|uniref:TonB C-terminal domain-containing protein n=2 Tax=Anabaena variabilis TaxID=264691 RepID=Q3M9I0_TRIV2|nr:MULTISPECIES: hypothetical protein [Nostocaceae]ABA22356.1 conserved hypothetical protein [Trichormus variabilis ATCC 29413]MBC1213245.1 hypothetical protein [Trichormus variabilis ARAD]MBC1255737.1 hypothetical protein [Trichormus variabilis V5]MBC1268075.1 hypothetical protein [Trichormus variabilis FSR]MBC1301788.1 hypothetical protein [Trichormus variabilis N2B]
MSYVSLLKNIPDILGQPTGIAAIASLGIHGAIALIVPLMPVDSNKSNESSPKSVGVLELSQADQSRLPQSADPNQVGLQAQLPLQSQFPQQPQLGNITSFNNQTAVLPPLPPPITPPISLPPVYTTPDNYRIASLPRSQPLRQSPRRDLRFDNSGFSAIGEKFTPTTPPSFNEREVIPETSRSLPVDRLPELNAAKLPDDLPPNPPSNTNPPVADSGSNAATVAPIEPQVAPIVQAPKAGDNLAFANESIPQWQQGSTLKTPELPWQNPQQRSEQGLIAQVNSYEDLRKSLQQAYPNSQEKAVIRSTVATDKPGVEGTVLGFLVVDTEGKVLDIKFQDKTVSPDLQLKAREYFTKNAPKGDRQISRYPFSLSIQNNSNNTAVTEDKNPGVVIPKPASTPLVNRTQPTTAPITTPKPLPQLQLREANPQPSAQVQIKKDQPTQTPTVQASPEMTSGKNQLSSTVESSQTLLEKLREARKQQQQRQEPNSSDR